MSVVKINAIEVPEAHRAELEKRFAARAGLVESSPGFEGFELLRPTSGETRYFVYTRWADEESYQAWVSSQSFAAGNAQERAERAAAEAAPASSDAAGGAADAHGADGGPGHGAEGGHPHAPAGDAHGHPRPIATGSALLGFEVVLKV
jgi:heme-degrading monooxygenase HmoA